jgi:hypothetical protein
MKPIIKFHSNTFMKSLGIVFFIALGTFISHASYAQLSAGLDLGLPTGDFSNIASTGFGGSVRYDGALGGKLGWSASVGYMSFSGKTYNINNVAIPFGNTSNVPLNGGIKYYFSEAGHGFYGGLDLSVNFLSTYVYTYNSGNGGGYNLQSDSQSKFGINPGVGYRLDTWDFSMRYNAVGDFSYLGIRAAYVFAKK